MTVELKYEAFIGEPDRVTVVPLRGQWVTSAVSGENPLQQLVVAR